MHSDQKLNEANFFLIQLNGAIRTPDHSFEYYLDAFMTACWSIPDMLLYDFAIIYNLGITREMIFRASDFELIVNALQINKYLQDDKPLKFIEWYNKNVKKLKDDPILKRRNYQIHRGFTSTVSQIDIISSSISVTGTFTALREWVYFSGITVPSIGGGALSPQDLQQIQYSESIYFEGEVSRDIPSLAKDTYDKMTIFLNEAKNYL